MKGSGYQKEVLDDVLVQDYLARCNSLALSLSSIEVDLREMSYPAIERGRIENLTRSINLLLKLRRNLLEGYQGEYPPIIDDVFALENRLVVIKSKCNEPKKKKRSKDSKHSIPDYWYPDRSPSIGKRNGCLLM